MRTRPLLPALLVSLALLAACGDDDEPDATSTSGSSASATPSATGAPSTPTETDEPDEPFAGDLAEDTSPASGNGLSVVDVRTGQHDGYDRLVLEMGGEGTVGWRVGYDDDPRRQGSGEPVDVEGSATLTVVVEGVGYPFDTGVEEYAGPRQQSPGLPSIREVVLGGVFEGYFDAFVGVQEARPFRVYRLDDPQRVVIDVQHPA